jgi:acyl carrier protein
MNDPNVGPAGYPKNPLGPPRTSRLAIVSLVFGFFGCTIVGALVAVITGHMANSDIRNSHGRLTGRPLAVIGLIFGYGSLFAGLIALVLCVGLVIVSYQSMRRDVPASVVVKLDELSAVTDKVRAIVAEQAGVAIERVTAAAALSDDLGIDDLGRAGLVMKLEDSFQIVIPDDEAQRAQTVGDFIRIVDGKSSKRARGVRVADPTVRAPVGRVGRPDRPIEKAAPAREPAAQAEPKASP